MQGVVMFFALVVVLIFGTIKAGGFSEVIDNAQAIEGFFSLTSIASPQWTPTAFSRSQTAYRCLGKREATAF